MPKPFPWDAPASSLIADAPEHLTMLGYALEQLDAKVPAAKVAKALGCGLSTLSNKLAAFRKESAGKTETPRRPASTIAPTPAAAVPPLPAGEGRGEGLPDPAPSPEPAPTPSPPPLFHSPGMLISALAHAAQAVYGAELLAEIAPEVLVAFLSERELAADVVIYDQGYRAGMRSRIP